MVPNPAARCRAPKAARGEAFDFSIRGSMSSTCADSVMVEACNASFRTTLAEPSALRTLQPRAVLAGPVLLPRSSPVLFNRALWA
jgi:hypothetical protein